MSYEHCEKHDCPATNGCAACESEDLRQRKLEVATTFIDAIEKAFLGCKHPHASEDWCNVCGARHLGDLWLSPHWRDILVHAFELGQHGNT